MVKSVIRFFDKLEDKVRGKLSHKPIVYAFLGGVGVVLFWRGIWHTMDYLMTLIAAKLPTSEVGSIDIGALPWWDGPISIVVGSTLLLISGIFVSSFIGNEIILSGLKGEKKIAEKTELEIKTETSALKKIREQTEQLSKQIGEIEKVLQEKKII